MYFGKFQFRYKITSTKFELDERHIDENYKCKIYKKYSRAYINHLLKTSELIGYNYISYHNVHFLINLMKEIREAIEFKFFEKMKEDWLG